VILKIKKIKKKTKKVEKKMADKTFDYTGLRCPMPVLKTKKELKNVDSGQIIKVIVDDVGAKKDIPAMLKKTGNELVELKEENGNLVFIIKKA
jgi:tRNA 2-thiouridine synthesizing protein A